MTGGHLPKWLWLWFPPILLFIILPIRVASPEFYAAHIDGELGLIELATPLISIIGFFIGLSLVRLAWPRVGRREKVWYLLVTLGCFYFAGEELSWGQHFFGWGTPEYLEQINDQEETNIHNISSWFDQKPRLLLELWVLVGGVVMVMVTGGRARGNNAWFWPPTECFPTAVLAILVRLPERVKSLFNIEQLPLELRFSEPQEYYFALFLLLYLAVARQRLKTVK
ncbi:MAG: hypothetical protein ACU84Q_06125 [Gammaproteobacteria bacterium]